MRHVTLVATLLFPLTASAVEVTKDTDELGLSAVEASQWKAFAETIWPGVTSGQFKTFNCERRPSVTRCTYVECVDVTAAEFTAHESAGRRISVTPHRIAADGGSAHAHVTWGPTELTGPQRTTHDNLTLSTFGVAVSTCARTYLEQEGGETLGHACYKTHVSDTERLLCLKNATCRR